MSLFSQYDIDSGHGYESMGLRWTDENHPLHSLGGLCSTRRLRNLGFCHRRLRYANVEDFRLFLNGDRQR